MRLGLSDPESVRLAAEELLAAARPEDEATGVLIAPMLSGTRELIAGVAFDEAFGPTVPPFTDVNNALAADLVKLPGVKPEAAERLVATRTAKGPYTTHEQVRAGLGLNERGYEPIKRFIYLKPASR